LKDLAIFFPKFKKFLIDFISYSIQSYQKALCYKAQM
jgi:hypothetical protein